MISTIIVGFLFAGVLIIVIYQFEQNRNIEELCVYYLRSFKPILNEKNSLLEKIVQRDENNQILISKIHQPRKNMKSILKKSLDIYLKPRAKPQKKKIKSLYKPRIKTVSFPKDSKFHFLCNFTQIQA